MPFGEALDEAIEDALQHTGDFAPPKSFGPMSGRDKRFAGPEAWFENRRKDDQVEWEGQKVWRVHGELYDLEPFMDLHPGGKWWLVQTRGMDITESFESSHPDIKKARAILAKYRLGPATKPRASPLTFHPQGFYATFRRRALPIIKAAGEAPKSKSKRIADGFVALWILGMVTAGRTKGWRSVAAAHFLTG